MKAPILVTDHRVLLLETICVSPAGAKGFRPYNGWIEGVNLADLVQLICLGGTEQELVIQKSGKKILHTFSNAFAIKALEAIQVYWPA